MLKRLGINFRQGLLEVVKKTGQPLYKFRDVDFADISRTPESEDENCDKDKQASALGAL